MARANGGGAGVGAVAPLSRRYRQGAQRPAEVLADVRSAARRWAAGLPGLPTDRADRAGSTLDGDLVLVLSELVTNSLKADATVIEVSAAAERDHVAVRVTDDGRGYPVMRTPGPADLHGRGLRIVDALATDWGASGDADGRTTVWVRMPLPAG